MIFTPTSFEGLIVIQPSVYADNRGYFFESYNKELFEANGLFLDFSQDNQSMSHQGALRGLHYQVPPFAQGKLVRVVRGAVNDIVVDIRRNSKTYGKYFSLKLSEENFTMLWIPTGFAHGFATLENNTLFSYKCTGVYNKASEGGILWNDPDLNIEWGIDAPLLSEKDKVNPKLRDITTPF
ncbi:MAG: dTDP-4-dehydrorhamnose 3,5-epimerase [Bacteroidetes bacterium]|nr:dTDP-4-dehydrorhamnose 3,5-epimerase [Bacteroidota bacterium]